MTDFYLLSKFLPEICWEKIAKEIFHISFWCLTCDTNQGFTSNKLTHYLLYCGDLSTYAGYTLQFKVDFEWQIFVQKLLDNFYSLSVFLPEKSNRLYIMLIGIARRPVLLKSHIVGVQIVQFTPKEEDHCHPYQIMTFSVYVVNLWIPCGLLSPQIQQFVWSHTHSFGNGLKC